MATLRWVLGAVVLVLAGVAGALLLTGRPHASSSAVMPESDTPAATWHAGRRRAPAFALRDSRGTPLSLASFHGRPLVVTFIDPLCRDYCPIEAQHLNTVVRSLPAAEKPVIVAVSVNTAGNKPEIFAQDKRKWKLVPQWRWAVGSDAQLARVWRAYGIDVLVSTRKIAGITVRRVAHTEASYVIDRNGYERALFIWPYSASGVASTLRLLASEREAQ